MEPEQASRRLEYLSRLGNFDVARDEPDPRGWTVVNRDGHKIGEVRDLVVDTNRMAATYLDVELDRKLFNLRDDNPHVLVPVERAHRDGRRLVVEEISTDWISELRRARAQHEYEFWDLWWRRTPLPEARLDAVGYRGRIQPRDRPDDLHRTIENVRPGEAVRIPVGDEDIIVERRPAMRREPIGDELMVNRDRDDEPPRR